MEKMKEKIKTVIIGLFCGVLAFLCILVMGINLLYAIRTGSLMP